MTGLVLANADYEGLVPPSRGHVTDEGAQLQRGLEAAGWTLAGFGYGDGSVYVPTLLERYKPSAVFVQDVRDWDATSGGCFDRRVSFQGSGVLAQHPEIYRVMPFKDAATDVDYQLGYARAVGIDALMVYYHPRAVLAACGEHEVAKRLPMIRTYHSVDSDTISGIDLTQPRKRGIVTGAIGGVYPLRAMCFERSGRLGLDVRRHPGYGNRGCDVADYLRTLAGYKVHVATSSRYGFALRKIVESVALGCTPVTDLPAWDVLPEIDGALLRVKPSASSDDLKGAIDQAERDWNLDERLAWSKAALAFYDWRLAGARLSAAIVEAARGVHAA